MMQKQLKEPIQFELLKKGEGPKIYYYVSCPFCGKTVVADKVKPSTLENFNISWEVLQAREQHAGPGRPRKGRKRQVPKGVYGFVLVPDLCLNIEEMLSNPQWRDLGKAIVHRIELIYSAYREAGLIK